MTAYPPLQLAEVFIQTGELSDALEILNTYLETEAQADAARRLRAQVLMRMSTPEYHQAALQDLYSLAEPTADDYVMMSTLLQPDWEQANQAMAYAYQLRSNDQRIVERYVHTLAMAGYLTEALLLADDMPMDWRWMRVRAELAQQIGEMQLAIDCYTAALADLEYTLDTNNDAIAANLKAALLSARASIEVNEGFFEEAINDYLIVEEIVPSDLTVRAYRALAIALNGDAQQGAYLLREIFAQAPDLRSLLAELDPHDARIAALLDLLRVL